MNHTIFNERPESQDRMIRMLTQMGYEYVSRSDAEEKRGNLSSVVFEDELRSFLNAQQYTFRGKEYHFSAESVTRAIRELDASLLQGLLMASKDVYNHLTGGISVEEKLFVEGDNLGVHSFDLKYIDFEHPERNKWQVTDEFSVERANGSYARPDIVLLCNGIPLVVIENKKSSVDVKEGVLQNVRNMMPDYIPQLFKYVQLVLAVNPNKVVYGTSGTTADYFVEWREQDIEWQESICKRCLQKEDMPIIEQDRITASLLDHKRLLEIIESFIIYDNNIKKVARHQQYFAVKHAMARIKGEDGKDTRSGVIWHTQGSGKSITMILLVKKIISDKSIENPRFLIVTDRINLDKQIRDNFANAAMQPSRAKTGSGLKTLIEDEGKIVVTTLINKFETVIKLGAKAKNSEKMFVFIDEAHRSNYSAMYNYMRDVLPESTFIAFTGTPLLGNTAKNPKERAMKKKDTYEKFGPSIDTYTMKKAIEDGITVPLVYEGRKVVQNDPSKRIDDYFESITKDLPDNLKDDLKQKWSRFKPLAETDSRLNLIAFDLADHFVNYCLPKKIKGILVCSSRAAAVDMYNILKRMDGIKPAVIISFGNKPEGDGDNLTSDALRKIETYYKEQVKPLFGDNVDLYDDTMTARFKSEDGDVNLLIVKDKLLTGFDAPIAGVLYIDKPIQQHSLLQAVARVNRVYKGKDFGLIVDYFGVFTKLNEAIDMYNDAEAGFENFDRADIEDAIFGPVDEKNKLKKSHEDLLEMFVGVSKNAQANEWQLFLKDDNKRHEFYDKLSTFAKRLDLALTNRAIYLEVGFKQLEEYRKDYLFFKKLKDAVTIRYNDSINFSKYEDGIRNLLNTFVMATDVHTVVKPVSINDVEGMKRILEKMETSDAKADAIKTKVVSELKQKRYDDPLLFKEFSERISKTLADYAELRDADAYLNEMERIADDLRNGRSTTDYPAKIENDSDAKAFYGAILNNFRLGETLTVSIEDEEIMGDCSIKIKEQIKKNAKRDWKYNPIAHKNMHRDLDDCLFDLFDELGIDCNDSKNIDVLDNIIEEIIRIALTRY